MTIGELRDLIKDYPDNMEVSIYDPTDSLQSEGTIQVFHRFINWGGEFVFLRSNKWRSKIIDRD